MKKKRLVTRDRKLREELKNKSREEIRRDFFELLKRAATTTDFRS
jgi:hypothetical protein